jgi:hypothetical protein
VPGRSHERDSDAVHVGLEGATREVDVRTHFPSVGMSGAASARPRGASRVSPPCWVAAPTWGRGAVKRRGPLTWQERPSWSSATAPTRGNTGDPTSYTSSTLESSIAGPSWA